ncbi:VWA domain-containing protein [Streptomyces sp. NA04227]|uniref:VWA domain-containing protein n=1 Tax=Streptomyces sp. NA04227 TaxID=2742136 RepID=UPI001590EA34|nr:VWA domain-containing protein [Streptomyces sp. NA04227]QKW07605.1 VWA domain-containing protein [Streptomyces sp. NA04227]
MSAGGDGAESAGVVEAAPVDGLTERLTDFVQALRGHDMRVGPGESAQAAEVLALLGLRDRERVRAGLAAVLLSAERQRTVFDAVFDVYFPLGVNDLLGDGRPEGDVSPDAAADVADAPELPSPPSQLDERALLEDLRDRIAAALAENDSGARARLAREAVGAFGRYGSGSGTDGWSAHQTLSRVQPQILLARVLAALRANRGGSGGSGGAGGGGEGASGQGGQGGQGGQAGQGGRAGQADQYVDRFEPDEIRRRIEAFRQEVRAEARRRVAERQGREKVAARARSLSADETDFRLTDARKRAELRRTVQPLARKLATRLAARRRRAARGTVDLRRSLRRSLSTGGVPLSLAYRRRRPARPEIVLLCDVSGSVAGFAHFTMLLVQAMRDQFSKLRVYAFVNRTDEVTDFVKAAGSGDPERLGERILTEATVSGWHGSSDYGTALGEFAERHLSAVGPRTTVLILGDARTNNWDPNLPALREIGERARTVQWLNPEPVSLWGTGDSAALHYAALVDMHPCRSVRQLGELVGRLVPV